RSPARASCGARSSPDRIGARPPHQINRIAPRQRTRDAATARGRRMTTNKPPLAGELLAEFLGTLVLIALGDGVVAMVVLFGKGTPGEVVHGGYTNITLGWGLAVLMGICVSGRVSGGHLNPAVTLVLAACRDFPWRKVLPYMISQIAGAFAGAALVYVNYLPAFRQFDPDLSRTATVFATAPAFPDAWMHGLLDQVVGT